MMNYSISASATKYVIKALIDEGANGGIRGKDMKLIGYNQDNQKFNVGITDDHQMTGMRVGMFCSAIPSKQGDFLGIWTIHLRTLIRE